jgi:hypothetical protein
MIPHPRIPKVCATKDLQISTGRVAKAPVRLWNQEENICVSSGYKSANLSLGI